MNGNAESSRALEREEWKERANCYGEDPKYFELVDHQNRKGWSGEQAIELLRAGQEYCIDCPVKATCGETATPSDRRWTIRAGKLPEALRLPARAKPNPSVGGHRLQKALVTPEQLKAGVCGRGHDVSDPETLTVRLSCRSCQAEDRKARMARYEKQRRARRPAGIGTGGHQRAKTHCPKGHEYSPGNVRFLDRKRVDGSSAQSRVCVTCHGGTPAHILGE